MAGYIVVTPLKHDGKRFAPGDKAPKLSDDAVAELLAAGVIAPDPDAPKGAGKQPRQQSGRQSGKRATQEAGDNTPAPDAEA